MEIFTGKASEMKGWAFMLVVLLLVVVGGFIALGIYNMLTTETILVTANNGSYIKRSFGVLSTADRVKAIDAINKKVADKDKAAAKAAA